MPKRWKLLKEEDVSPSKWFPLFKHTVQLPSGKVIDDYYVSKLGDVAMILAVTVDKEVVFVKQYKHGAGEVILELPAGRIGNLSPKEAAAAELEEETGYVAKDLNNLGTLILAPSKDTSRTNMFLCKDVEVKNAQKLDDTEDIQVVLVPANNVNEMILSGHIKAADTVAFLHIAMERFPEIFK